MSAPWTRPAHVAAAMLLVGGAAVAVVPQYSGTVLRLVAVSIAAAAALYAVEVIAPPRWWRSPFPAARRRRRRASTADELDWLRALISAPRQRLDGAPPLPPEIVRMLQTMDQGEASAPPVPWYRLLPPSPRAVARTVNALLDDRERRAAEAER